MGSPLIYIVEDDAEFIEIMESHFHDLHLSNYKVCLRGEECLDEFKKAKRYPDYVFLDFKMPGLNGMDTLKSIKKASKRTKVFIVTALDDKELSRKCLGAGASDYLVKNEEGLTKLRKILVNISEGAPVINKRLIAIIVVIVFILLAGFLFLKSKGII